MTEELEIDLEEENINRNKVEKRIRDLSEKVELTSKERDELKTLHEKTEQEKNTALKERDFYASFVDSTSKYPGAGEYKDVIKEKVMAGYSVEDATVSVLAKEGKLGLNQAPVEKETVAGGSAINQINNSSGIKPLGEMSRDEKRQAILEAEARGDISLS